MTEQEAHDSRASEQQQGTKDHQASDGAVVSPASSAARECSKGTKKGGSRTAAGRQQKGSQRAQEAWVDSEEGGNKRAR
eukprot:scaffold74219_cov53-Cyclotella_meneghiniana.AAC.2